MRMSSPPTTARSIVALPFVEETLPAATERALSRSRMLRAVASNEVAAASALVRVSDVGKLLLRARSPPASTSPLAAVASTSAQPAPNPNSRVDSSPVQLGADAQPQPQPQPPQLRRFDSVSTPQTPEGLSLIASSGGTVPPFLQRNAAVLATFSPVGSAAPKGPQTAEPTTIDPASTENSYPPLRSFTPLRAPPLASPRALAKPNRARSGSRLDGGAQFRGASDAPSLPRVLGGDTARGEIAPAVVLRGHACTIEPDAGYASSDYDDDDDTLGGRGVNLELFRRTLAHAPARMAQVKSATAVSPPAEKGVGGDVQGASPESATFSDDDANGDGGRANGGSPAAAYSDASASRELSSSALNMSARRVHRVTTAAQLNLLRRTLHSHKSGERLMHEVVSAGFVSSVAMASGKRCLQADSKRIEIDDFAAARARARGERAALVQPCPSPSAQMTATVRRSEVAHENENRAETTVNHMLVDDVGRANLRARSAARSLASLLLAPPSPLRAPSSLEFRFAAQPASTVAPDLPVPVLARAPHSMPPAPDEISTAIGLDAPGASVYSPAAARRVPPAPAAALAALLRSAPAGASPLNSSLGPSQTGPPAGRFPALAQPRLAAPSASPLRSGARARDELHAEGSLLPALIGSQGSPKESAGSGDLSAPVAKILADKFKAAFGGESDDDDDY